MGIFKAPRMDFTFGIRTWKSKEDYYAEEAIRRQDKIEALQKELAEYRELGTADYLRKLLTIHMDKPEEYDLEDILT